MNLLERAMVLGAVLLAGCGTTRNVAVSSYHVTRDVAVGSYRVATAPVHYALRRHSNEPTMVGTTDAIESDVTEPGHPAASTQVASAPQPRRKADTTRSQKPPKTTPPVAHTDTTQPEPKPSLRRKRPPRRRRSQLPRRCPTSRDTCLVHLIRAAGTLT